jgi:hypothetical protein
MEVSHALFDMESDGVDRFFDMPVEQGADLGKTVVHVPKEVVRERTRGLCRSSPYEAARHVLRSSSLCLELAKGERIEP